MSLPINRIAERTYDELKRRPGAVPRKSGARDGSVLDAVNRRLLELANAYRLNSDTERGVTFLFWSEVSREIDNGAFDDLLAGL